MWLVAKYNKNNLNILRKNLKDKLDENIKFYNPKIHYQKIIKNKIRSYEKNILVNYVLCYHDNFKKKSFLNYLSSTKGLDYFLPNFETNQKNLIDFINNCKNNEDERGFIKQCFFSSDNLKRIKFLQGPFAGQIFKVISQQKGNINILVGNITTSISSKASLLYLPN